MSIDVIHDTLISSFRKSALDYSDGVQSDEREYKVKQEDAKTLLVIVIKLHLRNDSPFCILALLSKYVLQLKSVTGLHGDRENASMTT